MEWISIWDKLPPEGEDVLIQYFNGSGDKNWVVGYYSKGVWHISNVPSPFVDDELESPEAWCEIEPYSVPLSNKEAWGYVENEDEMRALVDEIIAYALRTPQPTAEQWLKEESTDTTKEILNW